MFNDRPGALCGAPARAPAGRGPRCAARKAAVSDEAPNLREHSLRYTVIQREQYSGNWE